MSYCLEFIWKFFQRLWTRLERLLHCCEHEIASSDMCINFRKSGCLRVGPRCDIMCSTIVSSTGHELLWKSELRYLGVYLTISKSIRCSLDEAKGGFYRAAIANLSSMEKFDVGPTLGASVAKVSRTEVPWVGSTSGATVANVSNIEMFDVVPTLGANIVLLS